MMKKRLKVKINEEYIFVEQATTKEITRYLDHHIHGDKVYGSSQGWGKGVGGYYLMGMEFPFFKIKQFRRRVAQHFGYT